VATTTVAAQAAADTGALDLGTAASFAVLAGSAITFAGAVNTSQIAGDIGTFPTPAITGLENLILNGTNHGGDAIIQAAQVDLAAAYIDAAGRAFDVQYTGGFDLLGLSLGAGVYNSASSLFLSGNLTLDAHGNSDAVWIFQAGSTLITASNSSVTLLGGAQAGNVFWQVGSSATLGTGTSFAGSILALTSITVTTGATVNGRVLARNGAVTIDSTVVEVPVPVAQRITGSGTISGDLTVVGTLAPGSSPGVLTVDGTTTFTSGSIFEWQLDTTSGGGRGVAYDGLNTRAVAGNEAVFFIGLIGTQDFADTFWNETQSWGDIYKTVDGSADLPGNWSGAFGSFQYSYNGKTMAPSEEGSFSFAGTNDNTLIWTPNHTIPEASSLILGGLLGGGLLLGRRRTAGTMR